MRVYNYNLFKKHVTLKIYRANKIEKKYTNKQKNHNFIYLGKKEFIFYIINRCGFINEIKIIKQILLFNFSEILSKLRYIYRYIYKKSSN